MIFRIFVSLGEHRFAGTANRVWTGYLKVASRLERGDALLEDHDESSERLRRLARDANVRSHLLGRAGSLISTERSECRLLC